MTTLAILTTSTAITALTTEEYMVLEVIIQRPKKKHAVTMVTLKKQAYYHPSETHKGMKWVNLICLLCLILVNILFCKYYLECKLTTNQLHK